mmetsp:Transcript_5157/g.7142  ORF Transcript_5157/g.7142 Transcript_5157/m.7142 type:complete len:191 (+) Transcript_5157:123-695(+)
MAVRSSSRLQKIRQQQIEEGTLVPEDSSWQNFSKDLKPRKWHKIAVKVGSFTIMKWQPVDQKEATPGLGQLLQLQESAADHTPATGRARPRAGGRQKGVRGRGKGGKRSGGRLGGSAKRRTIEQVDDYVYYGGTAAVMTASGRGQSDNRGQNGNTQQQIAEYSDEAQHRRQDTHQQSIAGSSVEESPFRS